MAPRRRRWLAALGLFLASAVGGVVAYLLARRARQRREKAPSTDSVAELSDRLRREAAHRVRSSRRDHRLRWPWTARRRPPGGLRPCRRERAAAGNIPTGGEGDDRENPLAGA